MDNSNKSQEEIKSLPQNLIPQSGGILELKSCVRDEDTPAILLQEVIKKLLGPSCVTYEPDTIFLELERMDVEVPDLNKAKISMMNALVASDPVIYDYSVFKNAALLFNDEMPDVDVCEEVLPEQIAWAVKCFDLIYSPSTLYFDYDPIVYTATVLHREGYFFAPTPLDYAQEELDKLNKNIEIKDELVKAIGNADDNSDLVVEQRVKIARIGAYVLQKENELNAKRKELLP